MNQTIEKPSNTPAYENGYRFEREEARGKFLVRVIRQLRGGREKQEKYYSFRDLDARESYIAGVLVNAAKAEAYKAERVEAKKKARAEFKNPYKVGDVLYESWGYEQTNVNFYQIIKVTGRTVTFQEIGCESIGNEGGSSMSDNVHARKGAFLKNSVPETRAVQFYLGADGKAVHYVKFGRHSLSLDSGRSHYVSWYA